MSVVKVQVGLLGTARELQRDLNRMGNSVDTSTPGGLHYLLQETVLALRRNPQYAMYGVVSMLLCCCALIFEDRGRAQAVCATANLLLVPCFDLAEQ